MNASSRLKLENDLALHLFDQYSEIHKVRIEVYDTCVRLDIVFYNTLNYVSENPNSVEAELDLRQHMVGQDTCN